MNVLSKLTKSVSYAAPKFEPQENQTVIYNGEPYTVLWEIHGKKPRSFKIKNRKLTTIAKLSDLSSYTPKKSTESLNKWRIVLPSLEERIADSLPIKPS